MRHGPLRYGETELALNIFDHLGDRYLDSCIEIFYSLNDVDRMVEFLLMRSKEAHLNPIRILSTLREDKVKFIIYYKLFIKINHKLKHNKINFKDGSFEEFNRLFRIYTQ